MELAGGNEPEPVITTGRQTANRRCQVRQRIWISPTERAKAKEALRGSKPNHTARLSSDIEELTGADFFVRNDFGSILVQAKEGTDSTGGARAINAAPGLPDFLAARRVNRPMFPIKMDGDSFLRNGR